MIFKTKNKELTIFGKTLTETKGILIDFFDAFERGGIKGESGIIDTFFSKDKKSLLTPELLSDFENFKEIFNSSSLSAEVLAEQIENVDQRIVNYAKTCKNGEMTTKGFKASINTMSLSAKAGAIATKAFAIALNMIAFMAITKGIQLIATAIDNWVHRVEKANEAMKEAVSEYDSAKSSLESINSELAEQNKKLDELSSKDKLTYAEKGQLEELQRITKELMLQQDIEKRQVENASKEAAEKTVDAYKKQYGKYNLSKENLDEKFDYAKSSGIAPMSGGKNDVIGNIAAYVKAMEHLTEAQEKYENALKSGENVTWLADDLQYNIDLVEDISQMLDNNLSDLQEKRLALEEEYNKAIEKQKNDSASLTSSEQAIINTYESIYAAIKMVYEYAKPNDWNSMEIANIFNTEGIEKTKDELIAMAKAGELTPETIAGYANLNRAIQNSEIFLKNGQTAAETFCDEIYGCVNASKELKENMDETPLSFNISAYKDQIDDFQSALSTLQSALDSLNSGTLDGNAILDLMQQFPELEGKTNNLSEAIQNLIDDALDELLTSFGSDAPKEYIELLKSIASQAKGVASSHADTLSQVQALSKGLDQLDKIYADVKDKGDFDWSSILNNEDFRKQFGNMQNVTDQYKNAYEDFIKTISESPKDIGTCQEAFDSLATAYIYSSGVLQGVTEETKASTIAMLEQMGVANAAAIVEGQLAAQEMYLKLRTDDATVSIYDQIAGLIQHGNASDIACSALYELVAQERIFANTDLGVGGKIMELSKLAQAFGIAMDAAHSAQAYLDAARFAGSHGGKAVADAVVADMGSYYQNKIAAQFSSIKASYTGGSATQKGGSGSGTGNKGTKTGSDTSKQSKETVNWIERKLEILGKKLDVLKKKASEVFSTFKNQNKQLDKAIANIEKQIKTQEKAQTLYTKLANKVNLSDSLKKKVREGANSIEVEKYDSATKEKIDLYKEYYDAAVDAGNAIRDLRLEEKELARQKLSNIVDDYDRKKSYQEAQASLRKTKMENKATAKDYDFLISKQEHIRGNLEKEYTELEKLFNKLVKDEVISTYSDSWYEWKEALTKCKEELAACANEIRAIRALEFDDIVDNYDRKSALQEKQNQLIEAKAKGKLTEKNYNSMIKNTNHSKTRRQEEYDKLKKLFDEQVANDKNIKDASQKYVYSKRWYEDMEKLIEVQIAIEDCEEEIDGFAEKIMELRWENFDKGIEKLNKFQDILGDIESFFDGDMFDGANLTQSGLANLTIAYQGIASAKQEIEDYGSGIKNLKEQLKNGAITQDYYNEKLEEYQDAQRKASLQMKEYRDKIIDIYIQGLEAETDALRDLIDAKKEALQEEQKLQSYRDSIAKREKDIAILEKKIAELSKSSDRKDIAMRLQLEKELAEAREDLAKEQRDHNYELQEKALDDELEAFEKSQDEKIKDARNNLSTQEQILNEYLKKVQTNYSSTMDYISQYGEAFSHGLTDYLTSPWSESIQKATEYKALMEGILADPALNTTNTAVDKTQTDIKDKMQEAMDSVKGTFGQTAKLGLDMAMGNSTSSHELGSGSPLHLLEGVKQEPSELEGVPAMLEGVPAVSSISSTLKSGSKGADVKTLQDALKRLGFYTGAIDGTFGSKVVSAVKAFQKSTKVKGGTIAADGIVESKTKKKFKANGYESGVEDLKRDELARIDEGGKDEVVLRPNEGMLVPLQRHDYVLNHMQTEALMGWSKVNPAELMKGMASPPILPSISQAQPVTIGSIDASVNVSGVTRDEITKEITKKVDAIPSELMRTLRMNGVGVHGSRRH